MEIIGGGKKSRTQKGSKPAQIYEKSSVLEAKHIYTQKVQVESEATVGEGKNSLEFQDFCHWILSGLAPLLL